MTKSRSAENTIRGFNYQFIATIALLFEAADSGHVVIEGVEDIDLHDPGLETRAVQCKYYEGTKLTNSVLRDIVEPMLIDDNGRSAKITYYIYGYFKEQSQPDLSDADKFKQKVLAYKVGKAPNQLSKNLADDLSLTIEGIQDFLGRLKFTFTDNYESHLAKVERTIQNHFKCTSEEVINFFYPLAFSKVSDIATKSSLADRTISKKAFLEIFSIKQNVFNRWLLLAKGEEAYCKSMKRKYFAQLNISPFSRFFIIECTGSENPTVLKEALMAIRDRWSSHRKKSLATNDRYAPYILFLNTDQAKIIDLATELLNESIAFIDGYPFRDSPFTIKHISKPQTGENGISIRLLYSWEELLSVVSGVTGRTKEIFEFYTNTMRPLNPSIRHVQIPVKSVSSISTIV